MALDDAQPDALDEWGRSEPIHANDDGKPTSTTKWRYARDEPPTTTVDAKHDDEHGSQPALAAQHDAHDAAQ